MEDPTVLGMIYEDVKIIKKDVEDLKLSRARMIGGGLAISAIVTVIFQLIFAYVQRG